MPEFTYEAIEPLIAEATQHGANLVFVFRCPVSGQAAQARVGVEQGSPMSSLASGVSRSLLSSLRYSAAAAVRSALGHGALGRAAGQAVQSAIYSMGTGSSSSQPSISEARRRQAAVDAFQTVSGQFVWDPQGARWISARAAAELMSPFERQVAEAPIASAYDQAVLARMLVEISAVDGHLGDDERAMLSDLVPPAAGSVDTLLERPPLTEAELAETTEGPVRDSLLMLAAALAVCDEHFAAEERGRLDHYARGLGFADRRRDEALARARGFVLDQVLERVFGWGGHDEHARREVLAIASKIGMDERDAQIAEARFQKRRGMRAS
jgi:uncharacterized membrane protein YebE (DUF533 family)